MLNFFKKTTRSPESLYRSKKKKGRPSFHSLAVADITRETAECVSVAFAVPESLREAYQYVPGQYLTLEAEIEGEMVRRSYSLCSSPADGELRVAIKEVPEGRFSTYANRSLKVGEEMAVMTPDGNFLAELDPQQARDYVAFAAGSGITPVYSIMKSVLESNPKALLRCFTATKPASPSSSGRKLRP